MSLYTEDNYFGMEHEVLETKLYSYVRNGTEHEIIMCLCITYKENGSLLNVDTKYWMHYIYDQENGFTKDHSGKRSDEMDVVTYELFETYAEEIKQNEASK